MKEKKVTRYLFDCYLNCKYKAWLKIGGEHKFRKTDYQVLLDEQRNQIKTEFIKRLLFNDKKHLRLFKNISRKILSQNYDYIFDGYLSICLFEIQVDILEKVSIQSDLGSFSYIPIISIANEKVSKHDKLFLSLIGSRLHFFQGIMPKYGKIIYSNQIKTQKVKLLQAFDEVELIAQQIENLIKNLEKPIRMLNKHCFVCEFRQFCRTNAIEEDHLSLLSGINKKKIEKYNNKGIFTVNQLSYTFRPRRKRKKSSIKLPHHNHALKALALRENKTYILDTPLLSKTDTKIFFDFEGLPGFGFCYLIGMVVFSKNTVSEQSFWADSKNEENVIFLKFIDTVEQYKNYSLYHYGNYEIKHLKRVGKKLTRSKRNKTNIIIDSCSNILTLINSHIYFPTYSKSLKDMLKNVPNVKKTI
jgi:predicted RecB family nuclease